MPPNLPDWDELRSFMWDYVGIVRTTKHYKAKLKNTIATSK